MLGFYAQIYGQVYILSCEMAFHFATFNASASFSRLMQKTLQFDYSADESLSPLLDVTSWEIPCRTKRFSLNNLSTPVC